MKFTLFLLLTTVCFNAIGQGKLTILQDERIEKLSSKQIDLNKKDPKVDGFRVQIHFKDNQSRISSEKMRAKISNDFPEIKTYLEFKAPYYKIQLGDFMTKLEAFVLLKKISEKYVGAYIVKTDVYYESATTY
ncbi:MAG: SPOR domain-containing protein [Flavobacteriales bacterium]